MDIRDTPKLIYRSLMIVVTVGLGVGTIASFIYATPGNGLMLVGGILAIVTLMAGLSIFKLDAANAQSEIYREIVEEMRARSPLKLSLGEGGKLELELKESAVSVSYAEPEVHRVDNTTLDECKQMAAAGASIDEICRTVDPDHDRHDPVRQEAFRKIVRAMIGQRRV